MSVHPADSSSNVRSHAIMNAAIVLAAFLTWGSGTMWLDVLVGLMILYMNEDAAAHVELAARPPRPSRMTDDHLDAIRRNRSLPMNWNLSLDLATVSARTRIRRICGRPHFAIDPARKRSFANVGSEPFFDGCQSDRSRNLEGDIP